MSEVSSKKDRFAALGRIGVALMSEIDEERLLKTIACAACDLTGAQFAAFTLREADVTGRPVGPVQGHFFHLAAGVGVTDEQEEWFRRTLLDGKGLLAPIFQKGESVLIDDIERYTSASYHRRKPFQDSHNNNKEASPTPVGSLPLHSRVRSFLAAPLLNRNREVIGGLLLGHARPHCFSAEDEALLVGLAAQAAVALENARLSFLVSNQDIRERMLTENQIRRAVLSIVIDELPSSVFLVHGYDVKIILANRSAMSAWGANWHYQQPLKDFLDSNGIRIFDAHGIRVPFDQLAMVRASRYGESIYSREEIIRQPDGTDLPLLVNASVLDLNNYLNISAREIMDIVDDQHVAMVVHQDVSSLKKSEGAKDEFIGIAAHELRTPLAVLRGFVQTLDTQSGGHGSRLEDWQVESLHGINQATVRMAELIDELLDVSRLQSGSMDMQIGPHDLLALVQRVMKRMQTTTNKHTLVLDSDLDYLVTMMDAPHMEQVIYNLVSNAIKYTPQGGIIHMNVSSRQEETGENVALFSIQDRGIGIPLQEQSHVFQRFHRAENTREFGGTGLGLYVSRALVEYQHGNIWFYSVEGRGTIFYIALPLYHEEEGNGNAL
ncbi:GAF domain-containing sensor histidine kinase [Ktedonobacteria bacterium brp13]|nr:GAF domain-containing sensor histidine kinase [Ktedonobacteria bacterium brp13]